MISVLFRKYLYASPLGWSILSYLTDQGCSQVTTLGMLVNAIWAETLNVPVHLVGLCASAADPEKSTPQWLLTLWPGPWSLGLNPGQLSKHQLNQSTHQPVIKKNEYLSFWDGLLHSKNWLIYMNTLSHYSWKLQFGNSILSLITISFPSTCSTTLLPLSLLIHLIETSSPYSFSTRLFLVSRPT